MSVKLSKKILESAEAVASSSAGNNTLFKEDIPRAIKVGSYEFGKKETSEDNTLMGRLAGRMASKDLIDKQNLGLGSRAMNQAKAVTQEDAPGRVHIAGPSGLKHSDAPDSKFDKTELKKGIKIEKEHTNNPKIAKAITKAHLHEIPNYNTKLLKMEKKN